MSQSASQKEFSQKGFALLQAHQKKDGGIYHTNYITYNTALSLLAMNAHFKPEFEPAIRAGRTLLSQQQIDLNEAGKVDSPIDGGIGYGDGTPRANLANTIAALNALYETRRFADPTREKFDREKMIGFLKRCQHLAMVNHETWVREDATNGGGFVYFPGKSMARDVKLDSGEVIPQAYGSMTYAGLLGYAYMGLDRKDPAVVGALRWAGDHFSVNENPGAGPDGLYYYYWMMAKALSAWKVDKLKTSSGKEIDWREGLAAKLVSLQQKDGSWVNSKERWWESNPVLCTSYAVQALRTISQRN
jgi:squalene-hopene/tetraprenyl-beta-curcumene cyclase